MTNDKKEKKPRVTPPKALAVPKIISRPKAPKSRIILGTQTKAESED